MTRKHYEMIAKAIARQRRAWIATSMKPHDVLLALDDLASDLAGELAADNPHFDTARFLKACGADA